MAIALSSHPYPIRKLINEIAKELECLLVVIDAQLLQQVNEWDDGAWTVLNIIALSTLSSHDLNTERVLDILSNIPSTTVLELREEYRQRKLQHMSTAPCSLAMLMLLPENLSTIAPAEIEPESG